MVHGMNWMVKYKGVIDCTKKSISMVTSEEESAQFTATKSSTKVHCRESIAQPTLDQVPIICEYLDIFPEELPSMPPNRDIEFIIELIPKT